MVRTRLFTETAGILVSTTIGAGVFALPYLFVRAGWLTGLAVLAVLGGLLAYAHALYARVIEKEKNRHHLVGLAKEHLGRSGQVLATISLLGGLLVALVAYLLLAPGFFRLIWPDVSGVAVGMLFWLAGSMPLFRRLGFFVDVELWGAMFMLALTAGVIAISPEPFGILRLQPITGDGLPALFGATLFALGGWTAIHPMTNVAAATGRPRYDLRLAIGWGTALVVVVYALFVMGVVGASPQPAPDTVSDLSGFPAIAGMIMGALGLFAIWTSYVPIALEVRDSIMRDFRLRLARANLITLIAPIALVIIGLQSFSIAVVLGGGIFTAAQYILIVLLAKRVLRLGGRALLLANGVAAAFTLAAVYEIYAFVIG